MSGVPDDFSEREQRLGEIVSAYLDATRQGQTIDEQEILSRHPEFVAELREFLRDAAQVARLTEPLRTQTAATVGHRAFGDYELVRELGHGGMGVVYEAWQRSLQRRVALKMMRSSGVPAVEVLRFRNEAETIAALDHPGIVPVHDVGEHEGRLYFSMKLFEGGSLAGCLSRYRDDPAGAARLVAQVARAVHHAHQRGVLHRDLKPSNILLDQESRPHVADFGLAKRLHTGPDLTVSEALLGTPGYMAPEQAAGGRAPVTTAADIYGLGALLYALLTGDAPFRGPTPLDTLVLVRESVPRPLRLANPRVDRDLGTICQTCLARDPGRRYATAIAVADDLERWLRGEPIAARATSRLERVRSWCRRKPAVAGLSALAGLLLVAGVVGLAVSLAVIARERAEAVAWAQETRRRLYAYDMQHAARAWQFADAAQARETLARYVPGPGEEDLRGFEWYYLRHVSGGGNAPRRTLPGHTAAVFSVAYAPDGKTLATASRDRTVRLWDAATGQPGLVLHGHTDDVNCAAFSPDGKLLATASDDGTVRLWDATTGRPLDTLAHKPFWMQSVAFSPDGRRLAAAGDKGTVLLFDMPSGKLLPGEVAHRGHKVECVAFSADSKLLASAGRENGVGIWDATTGAPLRTLYGHTGGVCAVAFAHRTPCLATASQDGSVRLWDATTGSPLPAVGLHPEGVPVRCVAFSPDDATLASGDYIGCVRLWEVSGFGLTEVYPAHSLIAWSLAFAPDGKVLASASEDGTVRCWDATSQVHHRSLLRTPHELSPLAFGPDGTRLAVGLTDRVQLLDPATGDVHGTLPEVLHPGCLVLDRGGRLLAAGLFNGQVELWDLAIRQRRLAFQAHARGVTQAALTPDGRQLLTVSTHAVADGVRLWDAATGQQVRGFTADGQQSSAFALSADGRWLATAGGGHITLWDLQAGDIVKALPPQPRDVAFLAFSPDGRYLAAGCTDRRVELWDWRTNLPPRRMAGYDRAPALAFSPDGKTLAAGAERNVRLWHVATGQELMRLHTGLSVANLAFSPDGRRLVLAGGTPQGGEVLVCEAPRDQESAR